MKARKIISVLILMLAAVFSSAAQENAKKKVAIVIGNAAYKKNPLKNPVRDAESMRDKLIQIGFDVDFYKNLDTDGMHDALKKFYKEMDGADIAMIYYSGHGIESSSGANSGNYLIPVTDKIKNEDDLNDYATSLDDILQTCSEKDCKQLVVILDACRTNSFAGTSRGASRGLEVVNPPTEIDTVVVFSTAAGQTADDGDGNHSPFTQVLLDNIASKDKDFLAIMTTVTKEVKERTGGQTPYCTQSITNPVYLNGSPEDENIPNEIHTSSNALKIVVWILSIVIILIVLSGFLFLTEAGRKTCHAVASFFTGLWIKIKSPKVYKSACENYEETNNNVNPSVSMNEVKVESNSDLVNDTSNEVSINESSVVQPSVSSSVHNENTSASDIENKASDETMKKSSEIRQVKINDSFYISCCPVTVEQYNSLMGEKKITGSLYQPATNVNWKNAVEFCNRLSVKENLSPAYSVENGEVFFNSNASGYRLPGEKEWECAAGDNLNYFSNLDELAWFTDNSGNVLPECGKKKPNTFGVYDMLGLVREWCNDSIISGNRKWKILKGGAWDSDRSYCNVRVTDRAAADYESDNVGFRVARNI